VAALHHARAAVAVRIDRAGTTHATVRDGGCRSALVVGWAFEPLAAVHGAAAVRITDPSRFADHRFGTGVALRVAPAGSAMVHVTCTRCVAHGVRRAGVAITVAEARRAAMRITGAGGIAHGALGARVAIVRARSRRAMPVCGAHLRVATGIRRAGGRANQSRSHALAGHLRASHADRILAAVGVHHAPGGRRKASAAEPIPARRIRLAKAAIGAVGLTATRWVRAARGRRRARARGHDAAASTAPTASTTPAAARACTRCTARSRAPRARSIHRSPRLRCRRRPTTRYCRHH
jgi:hypothetical protein